MTFSFDPTRVTLKSMGPVSPILLDLEKARSSTPHPYPQKILWCGGARYFNFSTQKQYVTDAFRLPHSHYGGGISRGLELASVELGVSIHYKQKSPQKAKFREINAKDFDVLFVLIFYTFCY